MKNGKFDTQFKRDEPRASRYEAKSSIVMSWSSRKKNEGIFCTTYFCRKKLFNICFMSVYIVLKTLSEYIYFYVSKNIASYTFLLVFKIVDSL